MEKSEKIRVKLNYIRAVLPYLFYKTVWNHDVIKQDLQKWVECTNGVYPSEKTELAQLNRMLALPALKAFRNLFLLRLKTPDGNMWSFIGRCITRFLYSPLDSLYINTYNIGGGLYIQHGFSTIIVAERIGSNCWINQQVTIGYGENGCPVIEDDCEIRAGAKVIGNITMHKGSVAGANACVVKDVPENAVVGGVPAKIIKYRQTK